jgi:RNA polymerase sigma factor (TIGR02999 family)
MHEITRLLQATGNGDAAALESLVDLVYRELRTMASRRLSGEQGRCELQTTELLHEAWLRLFPGGETDWQNRAHFFGAAAEAMRRVLVDLARRRQALRRGGDQPACDLPAEVPAGTIDLDQVLDIDFALLDLAKAEPVHAELVKLRFFAGMTNQEASQVLGIGEATGQRYWAYARAWLLDRIGREADSFPD